MTVLVEHEYAATEEDELSIHPGDIISDVIKQDGGWWEGTLNGKKGVFPDNFVKVRICIDTTTCKFQDDRKI